MATKDLTTLLMVKQFKSGTPATDDGLLTGLITRISRLIEKYCDRTFGRDTYTDYLDGPGGPRLLLKHDPVISVATVHVSQDQVWDATSLIAASSYVVDFPGGTLQMKGSSFGGSFFTAAFFTAGFQNVRVIYDAGYDVIPRDVEQIAIEMVVRSYLDRGNLHLQSMSLGNGAFTKRYANRFYQDLLEDLGPYIRRRAQ